MSLQHKQQTQIVVIGAGLTGLSIAFFLKQKNLDVIVLEEKDRIGGQIHSFSDQGFVYESGPNTGVLSYPEVVEMFQTLDGVELTTAREEAKKRLIWKGNRFHALPANLTSAIFTPLFSWKDKFRILGEPFRSKGNNPDETVAQLAARRLGKSFVDYAVDPFLSGVYAGNPNTLVTRYALPKLYNLEQNYGSFIKGSIAKAKEPKTERDRLATRKVFSAQGGLSALVKALTNYINGKDSQQNIITGAKEVRIKPITDGQETARWRTEFIHNGKLCIIQSEYVITTVGSYNLSDMLSFAEAELLKQVNNLFYAPIVQAAVGYSNEALPDFQAFGGLVPSCEKQDILGILNPSACFDGRAPQGGNTLAVFMGGVRHQDYVQRSDSELEEMVLRNMHRMLGVRKDPQLLRIFKHAKAIPQYEVNSGERFAAIEKLERLYPGLYLKGNLCGGIGMADRIHQAYLTAQAIN